MTDRILTTKELGESLLETQIERQKHPEKYRGLPFGHPDLDRDTGGARRGEMIVVAGAQKVGKTTFAKNFAMSFSKRIAAAGLEEHVLYISLEMGHQSLGAKVYANEAGIDITKFRDYRLDDEDYARLKKAIAETKDLPGLWDTGTYSYNDLKNLLATYKESEEKIRVILVDYFQLFSSAGLRTGNQRHEQLAALSRQFKQIAMSLECTVVLLSQQSRTALTSFKKRKDPNYLAETQALARDCDMLIIILDKLDEDGQEVAHKRELYLGLSRNSQEGMTYDSIFSGKLARTGAPLGSEGDFDILEHAPQPRDEIRDWWLDL